ncbi:MAG TPA: AAA family ATPase [Flavitalea sp.]|nr:AAA family ATPase [Flavitalea sp.]
MELIERAGIIAGLQTAFNNVAAGEGHCVFISGEAGIGKTALVREFCRQQRNDCTIYHGACDALFTPRMLAPLYDIIWQVKSNLLPSSHTISDRSGLFANFFQALSNKQGMSLIVFEDIHWADEATFDFIKFFGRRIAQLRCLFILTYRDDEVNSRHPLRNVLADISSDVFSRIQLMPLSREAVHTLANAKGFDAENVYNISGGNPFYVNEILASYSPGIPENIKDSILAVYERQEEGTKNAWQLFSVVPEGLDIECFSIIKAGWDEGMDHCFALNVIIIKNEKIVFKHELYRRTIEASLSPFKRIALNKKILEVLLKTFQDDGLVEKIVHYAKNADQNHLVVEYAPIAAAQAASVGSHIEASKLYLTAIEYAQGADPDKLVDLYEAYAHECYLTNQFENAISYQEKAWAVWQDKDERKQLGNSLRLLSRFHAMAGNGEEAEKCGDQAIEIFRSTPSSKAKAMAFSNKSQLQMFSEDISECVEWGKKAIAMAQEINDQETLCHALANIGSAQCRVQLSREEGKKLLIESLGIGLRNSFHEHAARAYSNLIYNSLELKDYNASKHFLQEGIIYCEESGLDSFISYKLALKSRMLLETGDWKGAATIAENLLQNVSQPEAVRIDCNVILAKIKLRKGEPDSLSLLQDAKNSGFKMKEHRRIIPVVIALLEYEWLFSREVIASDELKYCIEIVQKIDSIFLNNSFVFWLRKARNLQVRLPEVLQADKIRKAASYWEEVGCPYEKALALAEGAEDLKLEALLIFQQLGADAVAERTKMEMRAAGIKRIPRGLRQSTKTNPAQLTNREIDVLHLLQKGIPNRQIAGTLFISPKTAEHHISNILFKLDVNSRLKAVDEAIRLGILK